MPKASNFWRALTDNSIVRAFGISILAHLVIFIVLEAGYGMGLWKARAPLANKFLTQADIERIQKIREEQQKQRDETPITLQFVEVDPARATEEPKETPYYSVANTRASNPDPKELEQPKIDGTQTKTPKVVDVIQPQAQSQPPPQQQQQAQKKQPDVMQPLANNQQRQEPEGNIPASEPREQEKKDLGFTNPNSRPRSLAEARARKGLIEGEAMKQEGGVKRGSLETNLDVKASPFGSYDAAFIAAVQKRWYHLMETHIPNRSGRVVVEFRLYPDGRIQALKITNNEVTETLAWLCQRAILDPSPYAPFPQDLRRLLAQEYRQVRFTFHYN